jgi:hypothetical protein
MTLRLNIDERKHWAHKVLDQVRAGFDVPDDDIRYALIVLGDVE